MAVGRIVPVQVDGVSWPVAGLCCQTGGGDRRVFLAWAPWPTSGFCLALPARAPADLPGSGRGHFWGAVSGEALGQPGSCVVLRTEAVSGFLPCQPWGIRVASLFSGQPGWAHMKGTLLVFWWNRRLRWLNYAFD